MNAAELAAAIYDQSVTDWPGELDFYLELCAPLQRSGGSVLEVACGTGRIALRLAQSGLPLTGVDLSPEMLAVARRKSGQAGNPRWLLGDMRSFDLGEIFERILIPGHSFQHMNSPADQLACLENLRRHLAAGGLLVVHLDHQDYAWLAGLPPPGDENFQPAGERRHPTSGRPLLVEHAWSLSPQTQTAWISARYSELDPQGQVLQRWERGPLPLHVLFRFEMEHLLRRAALRVEALYGSFTRTPLSAGSSEMIWLLST